MNHDTPETNYLLIFQRIRESETKLKNMGEQVQRYVRDKNNVDFEE